MMRVLVGHKMLDHGKPVGKEGCCTVYPNHVGVGGVGHGRCECGELSPHAETSTERRAWHKAHKHKMAGEPIAQPTIVVPDQDRKERKLVSIAPTTYRDVARSAKWNMVVEQLVAAHTKDGQVPERPLVEAAAATGVLYGWLWKYGPVFLDCLERAGYRVVKKS